MADPAEKVNNTRQSSQHETVDHVDIWQASLQRSLGRNDLVITEATGGENRLGTTVEAWTAGGR